MKQYCKMEVTFKNTLNFDNDLKFTKELRVDAVLVAVDDEVANETGCKGNKFGGSDIRPEEEMPEMFEEEEDGRKLIPAAVGLPRFAIGDEVDADEVGRSDPVAFAAAASIPPIIPMFG